VDCSTLATPHLAKEKKNYEDTKIIVFLFFELVNIKECNFQEISWDLYASIKSWDL
jgi:hypothetical protein